MHNTAPQAVKGGLGGEVNAETWLLFVLAPFGLGGLSGIDCGMASYPLILSASTVLLLAGCALGPRVEVASVALPESVPTYRLIRAEPSTAENAAVEGALRRQMQANGWREVEHSPVWRVEAAYSVRPQKTGSYSDETARVEQWVAEPQIPQWWARKRRVHSLTVSLNGPGESPTTYRASAAVTVRDRAPEATIEKLAEAVAAQLQPAS